MEENRPASSGSAAATPDPATAFRRQRAMRILRLAVLAVLAGFVLALFATYGERRRPQAQIKMTPSSGGAPAGGVVDRSEVFTISGSREGRPAFSLRAGSVTGLQGDRHLLQGVELTLHDAEGESITITGVTGEFDANDRRAQLNGDVVLQTQDGVRLQTGRLLYDSDRDMIFTADDIAFTAGGIQGQGRGLNYLVGERQIKIPDAVRLNVAAADGGAPIAITAGDLVAALDTDSVTLSDDVRLERAGDLLLGNYLRLQLDEGRRDVRAISAFGDVAVTLAPRPGRAAGELRADSLKGRLAGTGGLIDEAEASGTCRFTSGPYTSRSRTARFVQAKGLLELRGDPVLLTERERIAAQEIDLHTGDRRLEARGEVRSVSLGRGEAASGPSGGGAISFQADALRLDETAGRAAYVGSARAWQEGTAIQADEIVLDRTARQLRAAPRVMSRFTQRVPGAGGRPFVTALTADGMVFDDAGGTAAYRGNVRLSRLDAALTADEMDAYLIERGGQRVLDRIEARGSVAVKRGTSFATARLAEYRGATDLLVLKDDEGLAEVVDSATGRTMRGRMLTFDLAQDRILTETVPGGRTWITLSPDGRDTQAVEPKTRH